MGHALAPDPRPARFGVAVAAGCAIIRRMSRNHALGVRSCVDPGVPLDLATEYELVTS